MSPVTPTLHFSAFLSQSTLQGMKMANRVGQRFGDYRLIRFLGQGTFGDVYVGEHIYDKTFAAVKVLKTQLTPDNKPPPLSYKISTISYEIEQVVMTALAKDPKQRFKSVQAFANALEQAYRSKPIGATLLVYRGHSAGAKAVAWSPDGTRMASASHGVQVWQAV